MGADARPIPLPPSTKTSRPHSPTAAPFLTLFPFSVPLPVSPHPHIPAWCRASSAISAGWNSYRLQASQPRSPCSSKANAPSPSPTRSTHGPATPMPPLRAAPLRAAPLRPARGDDPGPPRRGHAAPGRSAAPARRGGTEPGPPGGDGASGWRRRDGVGGGGRRRRLPCQRYGGAGERGVGRRGSSRPARGIHSRPPLLSPVRVPPLVSPHMSFTPLESHHPCSSLGVPHPTRAPTLTSPTSSSPTRVLTVVSPPIFPCLTLLHLRPFQSCPTCVTKPMPVTRVTRS